LRAWFNALSTSWKSTGEVTSNEEVSAIPALSLFRSKSGTAACQEEVMCRQSRHST
jgi:hypothetical protein